MNTYLLLNTLQQIYENITFSPSEHCDWSEGWADEEGLAELQLALPLLLLSQSYDFSAGRATEVINTALPTICWSPVFSLTLFDPRQANVYFFFLFFFFYYNQRSNFIKLGLFDTCHLYFISTHTSQNLNKPNDNALTHSDTSITLSLKPCSSVLLPVFC